MWMFLCVLALVWFVMLFWKEEEEEEEGVLKERWDGTGACVLRECDRVS